MRKKARRDRMISHNISDLTISRALDLCGEFSEIEVAFMCEFLEPGDVAVEVGANIGSLTVPLANAVGEEGTFIASVPQPVLFQNLCANIALNGPCHVWTVNGAVGNRQGSVRLPKLEHTKPGTFSAHGIGSWEDGDTTGVLQLDDALKVSRCKFMKIDVEGMEANVIRGARDVIRRCRPVLNVENDRREKLLELIRLLQEMDYSLCWHLPPFFNPENYFREPDNEFRGIISINMLCKPVRLTVPRADIYRILSPDNWWSDILPAGATVGYRDKNILNTDLLRLGMRDRRSCYRPFSLCSRAAIFYKGASLRGRLVRGSYDYQ